MISNWQIIFGIICFVGLSNAKKIKSLKKFREYVIIANNMWKHQIDE